MKKSKLAKTEALVVTMTALLLGVALTSILVQTKGGFTHAIPDYGQGCWCHNNNIGVYINGSGDGMFSLTFGPFTVNSTFILKASTSNIHTTGAVPNYQQWMSTAGDNAKFKFFPTGVTDNSDDDLNKTAGNVTAIYTVTAPPTAGVYYLVLYAQGVLMSPITIQVSTETHITRFTATATTTTSTASSITASTSTTSSPTSSTTSVATSFQSYLGSPKGVASPGNGGDSLNSLVLIIVVVTLATFAPILYFLVGGIYLVVKRHKSG